MQLKRGYHVGVFSLAYTRYINKKGKRLGPYYYKSVRDDSGKVRSVYLGKDVGRGRMPLKIIIVFLFVLLITSSTLFLLQNRSLVLSKKTVEEIGVPFEVDQILIKVLIKTGEHLEKDVRIMNVGDEEKTIEVGVSGLYDIVDFDKKFAVKPGQTKIARFNFSSFNKEYGTEKLPGVYVGKIIVKTDSYENEIPLIVEIESKNVLFDMNLNPIARDRGILKGESKTIEVRLFNLQNIESFNVNMEYFVKDLNGNTIISEMENVVVKTQASFFKTLKIPESLKTGNYVFIAESSFGDSVGTASYLFEVEDAQEKEAAGFIEFCRNNPLCWGLSIIVLLLIFTTGAYLYFFVGAYIYKHVFGNPPKVKKARDIARKPKIFGKKESREQKEFGLKSKKQAVETKAEEKKKLAEKCRIHIYNGYNALDKNDFRKVKDTYIKLKDLYTELSSKDKAEIFKEVESFYRLSLKKYQLLKQAKKERNWRAGKG